MATIELVDVSKRYGVIEVLSSVSLALEEGSFTSLLGASGCGKTTMLNMIAGLDPPSSGEIRVEGKLAFSLERGIDLPTHRRNVGYVFQSYALWPHMRVLDNVTYPLRVRGVGKVERDNRGREMLERLELNGLAERYPFELSGGQQQRVAIARALVHHPHVLLLDEPLSNLDDQLRQRARAWIAKVHKDFNLTTVLVTHDHEEALSLSNRVVLLRAGHVEQDGSAHQIYEHPATVYAADFIGGVNQFDARVKTSERRPDGSFSSVVQFKDGVTLPVPADSLLESGDDVRVIVRANHVLLLPTKPSSPADGGKVLLPFSVVSVLYRGEDSEVIGSTPLGEARVIARDVPASADAFISFNAEDCRCLPAMPLQPSNGR